jgi:hypothetical protein
MQRPFLALTRLSFRPKDETASIIPDSFLIGPAPRLRTIYLDGISFPGLPKLLLSAIHLVIRSLEGIPHPGYISPEAMAIGQSSLIRLERLQLEFPIASIAPRPGTSTSTSIDTPAAARSHSLYVHGDQRIPGGPRGPDR